MTRATVSAQRVIIDADPGIDDSIAILMAFQAPEVEILGLTTVFGNVTIANATRNALLLCELAGHKEVPVAEGSSGPLKGGIPDVTDFVHGENGLGNIDLSTVPPIQADKIDKNATDFLIDMVSQHPGEITIIALGPLTNLALAIQKDPNFKSKVKKIHILGGAFLTLGNINPAAEANILSDPEAADIVFTSGATICDVGINITLQVKLTDAELKEIGSSGGRYAQFIYDITRFYEQFHIQSDGFYGIFLHDPTCFTALVHPELFTFENGVVRVETLQEAKCYGNTILDPGKKKWNSSNAWTGYPPVAVAWTVKVEEVISYVKESLMAS